MALQIRPLARAACGNVSIRAEANASAALPRVRHFGGRVGNNMPSMRREYEIFFRSGKQVAGPLDAANFSGHLLHAYYLLRDVHPSYDHYGSDARLHFARWEPPWHVDEPRRNRTRSKSSSGCIPPLGRLH